MDALSGMSGTVDAIMQVMNGTEWQNYTFWDNMRIAIAPGDGPPVPYLAVLACMATPFALLFIWELVIVSANTRAPRACKRLGLSPGEQSNLHDQYHDRYSPKSVSNADPSDGRIKAILLYPVKSCAPIDVASTSVLRTGFPYDREFVFAQLEKQPDASYKWKFITQRQFPKLALVRPEVWLPTGNSSKKSSSDYERGSLVVTFPAPNLGPVINFLRSLAPRLITRSLTAGPTVQFRIPLLPTLAERTKFALLTKPVRVWDDTPNAIDMGKLIPQSIKSDLASVLGVKNTLTIFRVLPDAERQVLRRAPPSDDIGYAPIHRFSDSYPLHLQNIASVQALANELPQSFPGRLSGLRFRANIYVAGPPAYAEDTWKRFSVQQPAAGNSNPRPFLVTLPTTRCALPNVDPATGTTVPYPRNAATRTPWRPGDAEDAGEEGSAYNEPSKTMKRLRCIDPLEPGKPCLGVQMLPATDPEGEAWEVRVGDRFTAQ
ncbi:hypothetical protein FH972_026662 [Carpinus fangiana]|uniref:MOSC domain-containing protein n=1 Tax=Carpinus fangiana TaxID=176857 RepID=A0A5N6L4R4_9ROSI|nr:hypothetical protein FH972_026662 [Carpinus fangiana]